MSYLRTPPEELLADLVIFPRFFFSLQAQERVSQGNVNNKNCQEQNFTKNDVCKNSSRITHPVKNRFFSVFSTFFTQNELCEILTDRKCDTIDFCVRTFTLRIHPE